MIWFLSDSSLNGRSISFGSSVREIHTRKKQQWVTPPPCLLSTTSKMWKSTVAASLDRNGKGYISADEFLLVPEFAVNPLSQRILRLFDGLNFKDFVALLSVFSAKANLVHKVEFIFKLYDADGDGGVTRNDVLEVLHDLSGPFLSIEQREQVVNQAFEESGYSVNNPLTMQDFLKLWDKTGFKMEVEVPVD